MNNTRSHLLSVGHGPHKQQSHMNLMRVFYPRGGCEIWSPLPGQACHLIIYTASLIINWPLKVARICWQIAVVCGFRLRWRLSTARPFSACLDESLKALLAPLMCALSNFVESKMDAALCFRMMLSGNTLPNKVKSHHFKKKNQNMSVW